MIARKKAAIAVQGAAEKFFRKQANLSEEGLSYVEISPEWCDELLDPASWYEVLETFARAMRLAVVLTDSEGCVLADCHNPQPAWRLVRAVRPEADGECPFCIAPATLCTAVKDALGTGGVVTVEDEAGLAHVAVPLSLGGHHVGAVIAGQVFCHNPKPLPLQRLARELGISEQQLWEAASQQVPITRDTLEVYANLLMSLGQAFVRQRYAVILHRKFAQTGQRYRLLFDGVKDYAIFTLNREGLVTSWNGGAEHLFGYSEAEIMGRNYLALVVPGDVDREALEQAMSKADRSGSIDYEGWRVRKDGTRFFGAGLLASMGAGDAREYGALLRDVTALRHSEEELRQAQKLEGIGVLAGGIAHDFNNLLTGIMGSLSHIKASLTPGDPVYPMVEIAEQSSARAAELIAQLLAYAGKGQFVITRFDFSALISEMLPLISASISKTVELELLLTSGLPWIEADATQIRQIVMNLIINGAEAIGAEGGTVRVSTGVSGSGTKVFMDVKDSGSGMSAATKAKIFDPFFTTKFAGRGLGLAAVSGIVRGHKGSMHVDSIPGHGTTFRVYFPAVPAEVPKSIDSPQSIVPRGTGTILVADDEPLLRQLAEMILKESGYSVLLASDGAEAVEIFRRHTPEITAVLLDMTMPVMGGHEALRLIKEIQPGIAVIMSSGYSEISAREELGPDAVAGFIHKPWIPTKLVESIQEALYHFAMQ